MKVLGIETSCDETGIALYDSTLGLLGHVLHSQVATHVEYGGVVPELSSRDHIQYTLPLIQQLLHETRLSLSDLDAIAYTQGPGLAGALLVGSSIAQSLSYALGIPAIGIHHLEGHLLAAMLEDTPPEFPFVALLVSGGHSQLIRVERLGQYEVLGDTLDDAAGEAFDKTAKLLGLGYPGGAALSALAEQGRAGRVTLPKSMLQSGDLDFSFSGLKTAVARVVAKAGESDLTPADIAHAFQDTIVTILASKACAALSQCQLTRLVIAGGVGANQELRRRLTALSQQHSFEVYYPRLEFCTDNGAMIALAGCLRLQAQWPQISMRGFGVQPRWSLSEL